MKNRHKLSKELKSQKMRFDFKVMLPRDCGHRAFYIRVDEKKPFRVYKVEHLFSAVSEAMDFEFFVSFRDLSRVKHHHDRSWERGFGLSCSVDDGIRIIDSLKKYGKCDLRKYFCG